ncbi:unnamed protein product [Brugia timori]|uniref:Uncharacterized protein n=1 Tax=Brugia timori TaxID=42155 RepID=A0A3P7T5J2_9BILA|nr:unnamed protein product [Brugia timori]
MKKRIADRTVLIIVVRTLFVTLISKMLTIGYEHQ